MSLLIHNFILISFPSFFVELYAVVLSVSWIAHVTDRAVDSSFVNGPENTAFYGVVFDAASLFSVQYSTSFTQDTY